MTGTAGAELLKDIIAHPDDDRLWGVLADYTEDEGDAGRAWLMRLDVPQVSWPGNPATAKPPHSDRIIELPCPWRAEQAEYRRGFVTAISLPLTAWMEDHGRFLRNYPLIRQVTLTDREPYYQPPPHLAAMPPPAEWDAMWPSVAREGERWWLPGELYGRLPRRYFPFHEFDDAVTPKDAALAALSVAALAWANAGRD